MVQRAGSERAEPLEAVSARLSQAEVPVAPSIPRPTEAPPPMRPPKATKSLPPTSGGKPQSLSSMEIPIGPDGQPLIDHRGRSKPLYQRRGTAKRPTKRWKPPWALDLLLGAFPGARLMATGEVTIGIAFAAVGLFAVLPAILVLANSGGRSGELEGLAIDQSWLLVHASVALVSVVTFEILRLASAFDPRSRADKLPRMFAAFALPALLVLFGAPLVVRHAPRIIEAMWFGALILSAGALIAGAWCSLRELGDSSKRKLWLEIVGGVVVLGGIVVLVLTLDAATWNILGASAKDAGFLLLPDLFYSLAGR